MNKKYEIKTERLYVDIELAAYIENYRDVRRFEALCRQCGNYGRSWGCPPFEKDIETELIRYDRIRIYASVIIPEKKDIPLSETQDVIYPERSYMEKKLLKMEQEYDGLAFAFVGKCLYCKEECSRIKGEKCRHPEKVRPSLEGYGFNLTTTLKDFFSLEFEWSENNCVPGKIILISAFAYSQKSDLRAE